MTLCRGYTVDNMRVALSKWDQPGVFANFQLFKVLEQSNKVGQMWRTRGERSETINRTLCRALQTRIVKSAVDISVP